MTPAPNAPAAVRTGPVSVVFSQPLTAASAAALQVFGSQRGGRRTGATPAVVSGSTLSYAPTAYPFLPGEEVQATVTTAAAGSGGALARPRVVQFTAATGGTGQGNFLPSAARPDVLYYNGAIARSYGAFDFDGDGDLDLVVPTGVVYGACHTCGSTTTIALYVNDGNGRFTAAAPIVITMPGTSVFSTEGPIRVGDVDGDGDLDFLLEGGMGRWFLNNGRGSFTRGNSSGATGRLLVVGDVDGDGDLDVIGMGGGANSSVSLNDGLGSFTAAPGFARASTSLDAALGDVDGDGDLDLVEIVRGARPGMPSGTVYLNNGAGDFAAGMPLSLGSDLETLRLGDVDGDGDPDLVVCNYGRGGVGSVSVRLNDGTGAFAPPATNPTPIMNTNVISDRTELRDVDGDGDLDLLVLGYSGSQSSSASIFIRLNQPSGVLAAARAGSGASAPLLLAPNPARSAVALTGAAAHAAVEVLDALGRAVLVSKADAMGAVNLSLPAGLPAGFYLVRSGSQVGRLVVE